MKLEPGKYHCTTTGAELIEYESGAVMCRIKTDIGLYAQICLVQKDGALSERGFKNVMGVFGIEQWKWEDWEGDPKKWEGAKVEAVVEEREGEKGTFLTIKYLNPANVKREEKPNNTNVKALAAKYGAKTRAMLGGEVSSPKPGVKPSISPTPKEEIDNLPF